MKIVMTGGAGFIAKAVTRQILDFEGGKLDGQTVDEIVHSDVALSLYKHTKVKARIDDVTDPKAVEVLIDEGVDGVFHLAGVVSVGAERNFELGYAVNLDGTRHVLEACRKAGAKRGKPVKLVFATTFAVYGGALPDIITDDTAERPETSYGGQKRMGEILINDYSRRGFLDGRSVRLNTILVRPGLPNLAASTWVSSIIREPLSGEDVVCPVKPDTRMIILGPLKTADSMVKAYNIDAEKLGKDRTILLNGLSATAADVVAAVERFGKTRKLGKIKWELDPVIQRICDSWPKRAGGKKAPSLGMEIDGSIDEIIQQFIDHDLQDHLKMVGKA